jgi:hypothetical protein
MKTPGFTTEGDAHAKLSLPCCDCGIVTPSTCCDLGVQVLCCKAEVAMLPTEERPLGCGCCFVNAVYDDGIKVGVFKVSQR